MSFGRLRENSVKPQAEINMIPLIDVMLVLLVIFILTAPLVTQSVDLKLPETVNLENNPNLLKEDKPIVIAINGQSELHINERLFLSDSEIIIELERLKHEAGVDKPIVQLHIDASVPYEMVAKIITDLSKVGLPNIGFVSLPKEEATIK